MKKIISLMIITLSVTLLGAQPPKKATWDFNTLDGWEYGHQGDNPELNQCNLDDGKLWIYTRAGSYDRKKIRTEDKIYTTGRYTWRTYIPQMGIGDQASVGSWIYCDDTHEIDFEVGYGTSKVRKQLNAAPDEMIAYSTTQANPFQSLPVKIKTGWHIFEIDLSLRDGKYYVQWFIDGELVGAVHQTYGDEYAFYIFCSVENLKFIGDHPPTQENYGIFDYVKYKFHK